MVPWFATYMTHARCLAQRWPAVNQSTKMRAFCSLLGNITYANGEIVSFAWRQGSDDKPEGGRVI